MNQVSYLERQNIKDDLRDLVYENLEVLSKYEGKECSRCGLVQGQPHKGWRKFYCNHITKAVDRKMNKKNKEVAMRAVEILVLPAA